jgi:hypothetical protein
MSSLLEQAIVDATALRQAAIKNAEKDLVEKYSNQIKEAVDKLLEQEMSSEVAPEEDPMDVASSLENVPSDLGKSKKGSKPSLEQQLKEKTPDSYMSDDDKLIEIDFSELSKETPDIEQPEAPAGDLSAGMATLPVTPVPAMGAAPAAAPVPAAPAAPLAEGLYDQNSDGDEGDSDDLEEEIGYTQPTALDEEDMFEYSESDLGEAGVGFGEGPEYVEQGSGLYNEEEVDEELLVNFEGEGEEQEEVSMTPQYGELEEETTVEVDTDNVASGHRGVTTKETRDAVTNELARRKDDKYKLKLKKLQDAIEESDKEIKSAKELNEGLKKQNLELKNLLRSLKEHIEEMNLSNAKLLYTNRVLEDSSLNERQKKTIVESISKTSTIESAKIAFETLQSAAQSAKSEIKSPKSLNEAVSRSSSPFLVRPRASQETNSYSERMKKLAGIIKE